MAASNLTQILSSYTDKLDFVRQICVAQIATKGSNLKSNLSLASEGLPKKQAKCSFLDKSCEDYFKLSIYSLTAAISSSLRFLACSCMTLPMPKLLFEPSL